MSDINIKPYRSMQMLIADRLNLNIKLSHPFDAQEGLPCTCETPLAAPLLIFLVGECYGPPMRC